MLYLVLIPLAALNIYMGILMNMWYSWMAAGFIIGMMVAHLIQTIVDRL